MAQIRLVRTLPSLDIAWERIQCVSLTSASLARRNATRRVAPIAKTVKHLRNLVLHTCWRLGFFRSAADRPNEPWLVDFVLKEFVKGREVHTFTLVDDRSCVEARLREADQRLSLQTDHVGRRQTLG